MQVRPGDRFACVDLETQPTADGLLPTEVGVVCVDSTGALGAAVELLDRTGNSRAAWTDRWPELRPYVDGAVLCAHNLAYDRSVLLRVFPLLRSAARVDTLPLVRSALAGEIPDYALTTVLAHLGLTAEVEGLALNDHFTPHRALYDAAGCAVLLRHFLQRRPADLVTAEQGELFPR
jgi:hypothetical protein